MAIDTKKGPVAQDAQARFAENKKILEALKTEFKATTDAERTKLINMTNALGNLIGEFEADGNKRELQEAYLLASKALSQIAELEPSNSKKLGQIISASGFAVNAEGMSDIDKNIAQEAKTIVEGLEFRKDELEREIARTPPSVSTPVPALATTAIPLSQLTEKDRDDFVRRADQWLSLSAAAGIRAKITAQDSRLASQDFLRSDEGILMFTKATMLEWQARVASGGDSAFKSTIAGATSISQLSVVAASSWKTYASMMVDQGMLESGNFAVLTQQEKDSIRGFANGTGSLGDATDIILKRWLEIEREAKARAELPPPPVPVAASVQTNATSQAELLPPPPAPALGSVQAPEWSEDGEPEGLFDHPTAPA